MKATVISWAEFTSGGLKKYILHPSLGEVFTVRCGHPQHQHVLRKIRVGPPEEGDSELQRLKWMHLIKGKLKDIPTKRFILVDGEANPVAVVGSAMQEGRAKAKKAGKSSAKQTAVGEQVRFKKGGRKAGMRSTLPSEAFQARVRERLLDLGVETALEHAEPSFLLALHCCGIFTPAAASAITGRLQQAAELTNNVVEAAGKKAAKKKAAKKASKSGGKNAAKKAPGKKAGKQIAKQTATAKKQAKKQAEEQSAKKEDSAGSAPPKSVGAAGL